MKISVLLAHPDKNSFNHAIANTAVNELKKNGHSLCFHDLYEERFDPLLPVSELSGDVLLSPEIESHCREISDADGIIIIHPNWWGQPPAVLKGWVDRVLRPGIAYEFINGDKGEGVPIGLLRAKTVLVFNTSNTETKRELKIFGDPLETIWKNCIFGLCGVKNFYRETFNVIITSGPDKRNEWLQKVKFLVNEYFAV